jgi:hypothetical protein
MGFAERPSFIPDMSGEPIDFAWDGPEAHIGPTETVTPLLDLLAGTTTCGQVTMCAGVLLWGAWRLKGHTAVEHNFELAEAAFAWQIDYRYIDVDRGPKGKPPDQPPAQSAMMKLNSFMRREMDADEYWNSYYQPVRETFHSAHLVRHILPKDARKEFETWLKGLVARVKEIASKPDEEFRKKKEFESPEAHRAFVSRHRGSPLPPEILAPQSKVTPELQRDLVMQFLGGLNPSSNRYLRSPEELKASGLEAMPYGA